MIFKWNAITSKSADWNWIWVYSHENSIITALIVRMFSMSVNGNFINTNKLFLVNELIQQYFWFRLNIRICFCLCIHNLCIHFGLHKKKYQIQLKCPIVFDSILVWCFWWFEWPSENREMMKITTRVHGAMLIKFKPYSSYTFFGISSSGFCFLFHVDVCRIKFPQEMRESSTVTVREVKIVS